MLVSWSSVSDEGGGGNADKSSKHRNDGCDDGRLNCEWSCGGGGGGGGGDDDDGSCGGGCNGISCWVCGCNESDVSTGNNDRIWAEIWGLYSLLIVDDVNCLVDLKRGRNCLSWRDSPWKCSGGLLSLKGTSGGAWGCGCNIGTFVTGFSLFWVSFMNNSFIVWFKFLLRISLYSPVGIGWKFGATQFSNPVELICISVK